MKLGRRSLPDRKGRKLRRAVRSRSRSIDWDGKGPQAWWEINVERWIGAGLQMI